MLSFGTIAIFWDWRTLRSWQLQGPKIKSWWTLYPKGSLWFAVFQEIWSLQVRVPASPEIIHKQDTWGDMQYLGLQRSKWNSWRCSRKGTDCTLCGLKFRLRGWTSDTWQAVQLHYSEQSCNRSPWEKDHKSQMVKPILMKPMVLDPGHPRLPQCEISNIEDQ